MSINRREEASLRPSSSVTFARVTTTAQPPAILQTAVTRRVLAVAIVWFVAVALCILCDRVTVTTCPADVSFSGNQVCPDGHVRFGSTGLVWVILAALAGFAALGIAWRRARRKATKVFDGNLVETTARRFLSRRALCVICVSSLSERSWSHI